MTDMNQQIDGLKRHLGIGYTNQEETERLMKEWITKGWLVLRKNLGPYVEWNKVR